MRAMIDIRESVIEKLRDREIELGMKLANGQAKDYAEYCRATGRIAGMKEAVDIINEYFKELDNDDS